MYVTIPSKVILKFLLTLLIFASLLFTATQGVSARSGCCSHHDGVCGCGCCDGSPLSNTCTPYYLECSGGGAAKQVVRKPTATAKPTSQPTSRSIPSATPKPTSKPIAHPTKCSDVSDSICPKNCTAGNDIDCCRSKSGYSWYERYGCYRSTDATCSATQDNKCSSMCTAGNDYDCCTKKDGYIWYNNWGCYPKKLV